MSTGASRMCNWPTSFDASNAPGTVLRALKQQPSKAIRWTRSVSETDDLERLRRLLTASCTIGWTRRVSETDDLQHWRGA